MTKICTCWPGNHFTESFYLQTFSVTRAKERNTLSEQNTTKHTQRTNVARERENDPDADHTYEPNTDQRTKRRSTSVPNTTAWSPASRRSASIVIAIDASCDRDSDDRDLAFVCSDLMIFFWVLFVFWGMNDIMYSFGNRENVSNK